MLSGIRVQGSNTSALNSSSRWSSRNSSWTMRRRRLKTSRSFGSQGVDPHRRGLSRTVDAPQQQPPPGEMQHLVLVLVDVDDARTAQPPPVGPPPGCIQRVGRVQQNHRQHGIGKTVSATRLMGANNSPQQNPHHKRHGSPQSAGSR